MMPENVAKVGRKFELDHFLAKSIHTENVARGGLSWEYRLRVWDCVLVSACFCTCALFAQNAVCWSVARIISNISGRSNWSDSREGRTACLETWFRSSPHLNRNPRAKQYYYTRARANSFAASMQGDENVIHCTTKLEVGNFMTVCNKSGKIDMDSQSSNAALQRSKIMCGIVRTGACGLAACRLAVVRLAPGDKNWYEHNRSHACYWTPYSVVHTYGKYCWY